MILKFNPQLFLCEDNHILSMISKIILELIEDTFMWDIDNLDELFLNNDNFTQFINKWLSEGHRENIVGIISEIFQKSAYITTCHKKYLTTLNVGLNASETNPQLAYYILRKPSKIIIENTHDWNFIKGISHKYENHKTRKSIYKLIKKAIDNNSLLSDPAGGKGQIKTRVNDLGGNAYGGILKYKVMALFDSDRINEEELNHEQKLIIEYLKNQSINNLHEAICNEQADIIIWHMLYKRELENYVPKSIVLSLNDISEEEKNKVNDLSRELPQYDFTDFENLFKDNTEINVKHDFPRLFLSEWTRDLLEQHCSHHKVSIELPNGTLEQVSEVEQILLKIAKII